MESNLSTSVNFDAIRKQERDNAEKNIVNENAVNAKHLKEKLFDAVPEENVKGLDKAARGIGNVIHNANTKAKEIKNRFEIINEKVTGVLPESNKQHKHEVVTQGDSR